MACLGRPDGFLMVSALVYVMHIGQDLCYWEVYMQWIVGQGPEHLASHCNKHRCLDIRKSHRVEVPGVNEIYCDFKVIYIDWNRSGTFGSKVVGVHKWLLNLKFCFKSLRITLNGQYMVKSPMRGEKSGISTLHPELDPSNP
uniref:Uncharacterized protein n=1 Tax=Vitis vinifera TaxID=29760 RepID=A5BSA2_VITVI|nr:hypothetical protein VITISV_023657 [Vitis vinifera]